MLRIVQLEEIQALLLRVPALVDRQEQRDPDFADVVKAWLGDLEDALENNRLPAAGRVAAARGTLISAERGAVPPDVVLHGSRQLRPHPPHVTTGNHPHGLHNHLSPTKAMSQ